MCVCFFRKGGQLAIIALYDDNLLIASRGRSILEKVKSSLSNRLKVKNLGEARLCLGLEISRDGSKRKLWVGQSRYAGGSLIGLEYRMQKVVTRL